MHKADFCAYKVYASFSCMFPSASCVLGFNRWYKEPQKEGGFVAVFELLPLVTSLHDAHFFTLCKGYSTNQFHCSCYEFVNSSVHIYSSTMGLQEH